LFPNRSAAGHKGTFGHVVLVAGSEGKTGAGVLSGLGCLRTGVGLVSLCVPEKLNPVFEMHLIEAMTIPVAGDHGTCFGNGDFDRIITACKGKSCVVIGPGLGLAAGTGQLVNQLVRETKIPLVVDADGLNLLDIRMVAEMPEKDIVLTPHPGEMARLTGLTVAEIQQNRVQAAVDLAEKLGVVVVLKGAATVIAGPAGEVAINSTGNSGMGTGGMGDVLSGVISGFLAQGLSCFDAACLGVYSHGRAGDLLAEQGMPFGYLASELADALPDVWQEFSQD
jgi:NAD(P)H-hydrate epimerase